MHIIHAIFYSATFVGSNLWEKSANPQSLLQEVQGPNLQSTVEIKTRKNCNLTIFHIVPNFLFIELETSNFGHFPKNLVLPANPQSLLQDVQGPNWQSTVEIKKDN